MVILLLIKLNLFIFLLLHCKPCTLNRKKALIFFSGTRKQKANVCWYYHIKSQTLILQIRMIGSMGVLLIWLAGVLYNSKIRKNSTFLFKTLPFYLLLFLSILSVFNDCHGQLRSILITIWWISALLL